MSYPTSSPETVTLHKIRFGFIQHIDRHLVDQCTLAIHDDLLYCTGQELAIRVNGFVFGEGLDVIRVKYPADWKQAVKERWAPKWLLRRWPVRYTTHSYDLEAIYPQIADRISLPDQEHFLHLVRC